GAQISTDGEAGGAAGAFAAIFAQMSQGTEVQTEQPAAAEQAGAAALKLPEVCQANLPSEELPVAPTPTEVFPDELPPEAIANVPQQLPQIAGAWHCLALAPVQSEVQEEPVAEVEPEHEE